ncbi:MAG: methyltransferase domain-containing protein [Rhodobacterales bacterium]|nr:methyltransferase domain-containing protein [Rhodobacterales bacterium]NCT13556.1 methyltransferase domain-containing protein [Rhodobacterales bacterium]
MTASVEARRDSVVRQLQRRLDLAFARMRGVHPRHCPVCDTTSWFAAFGHPPRNDARCCHCGALERHRLFMLYVTRTAFFAPDQRLLHFAPERQLSAHVRAAVGVYETADLDPALRVTHHINIEATGLPDAEYDRIICNHVLEHVNDAKALTEIFRLLKPGGRAILSTPVIEGWAQTYENPAITDPAGRKLHFGQHDHVRFFGRDIRDRIRAAGFALEEFAAVEPDVLAYGLNRGETLFIATRPAG